MGKKKAPAKKAPASVASVDAVRRKAEAAIDHALTFAGHDYSTHEDPRAYLQVAIYDLAKEQAAVSKDYAESLAERLRSIADEIDPDSTKANWIRVPAGQLAKEATKDMAKARWALYDAADTLREAVEECVDELARRGCDEEDEKLHRKFRDLMRTRAKAAEASADAMHRWFSKSTDEEATRDAAAEA
jgi:hypothetical protein